MPRRNFNDFRFAGLNWKKKSNKYLTMNRVSDDGQRIVVNVGNSHIMATIYGYALILDNTHVVFLKDWQVSQSCYGIEVLLQKEFFKVKQWGNYVDFDDMPENLNFENWLEIARSQDAIAGENGVKLNTVKWKV